MNKGKDSGAFLILAGVLILSVFTYVSVINILPNNSSDSFFSKDDNELNVSIKDIKTENGKIQINVDRDNVYICAKQTKTKPNQNSLCWKKEESRKVEIAVYSGKSYYIWLMDNEKNISNYVLFNTNTNEITYE